MNYSYELFTHFSQKDTLVRQRTLSMLHTAATEQALNSSTDRAVSCMQCETTEKFWQNSCVLTRRYTSGSQREWNMKASETHALPPDSTSSVWNVDTVHTQAKNITRFFFIILIFPIVCALTFAVFPQQQQTAAAAAKRRIAVLLYRNNFRASGSLWLLYRLNVSVNHRTKSRRKSKWAKTIHPSVEHTNRRDSHRIVWRGASCANFSGFSTNSVLPLHQF